MFLQGLTGSRRSSMRSTFLPRKYALVGNGCARVQSGALKFQFGMIASSCNAHECSQSADLELVEPYPTGCVGIGGEAGGRRKRRHLLNLR